METVPISREELLALPPGETVWRVTRDMDVLQVYPGKPEVWGPYIILYVGRVQGFRGGAVRFTTPDGREGYLPIQHFLGRVPLTGVFRNKESAETYIVQESRRKRLARKRMEKGIRPANA
jgi:hypothetical protein